MSLRGVGIDVTDIRRIARLVESYGVRFTRRWFTHAEIAESDASGSPVHALAARFAAKEAVWKAIGIEWNGPVPWRSIAVLDTGGVPAVRLMGPVAAAAYASGVSVVRIAVTISEGRAIATAIAEQDLAASDAFGAPVAATPQLLSGGTRAQAGSCSS